MNVFMTVRIELKREIRMGGVRKNEGGLVTISASGEFINKPENGLEDLFSSIKSYVDNFNNQIDSKLAKCKKEIVD